SQPDLAPLGLLDPFWLNRSDTMTREGLLFVQPAGGRPEAKLLFAPDKVISLHSATGETAFVEGKDFVVDKAARTIRLPEGSRVPFVTAEGLFPAADSKQPKISHKRGDPKTCLLWAEGSYYHKLQAEVTYSHGDKWAGAVPTSGPADLPGTRGKLRAGQAITVCLSGDSISAGYNASGMTKVPPLMPCYGQLVADQLAATCGSKVTFRNFAVGGWSCTNGLADAPRVAATKPDLVIIAYGMNDTGRSAADFAKNIKGIMDVVRKENAEAEFVLVSPMLGNADWSALNMAAFANERKALAGLTGPGVALADMTSLWEAMLATGKRWHDMTGNGVNHPNDFGHRLYAQAILTLLVEADKGAGR
ncbi:MAG: SGNH/GDSL hydrolase family protein, partial [Phycisphaerae bacterium]|nr:SGNH/GDSL hydrolase family protein [Phycisphaerae bacterium]